MTSGRDMVNNSRTMTTARDHFEMFRFSVIQSSFSFEGLPGGVLVPLFPANIALCSHVPMLSIYYIRIFSYRNFSNSVPLFPKIG